VYTHDDKELIPALVSSFIKGFHGRYGSISVMSSSRQFISVGEDNWNWLKLPRDFNLTDPLQIGIPNDNSSIFIVRYFALGGDGRAFLGLSCSKRLLFVVKLFNPDEKPSSQTPRDLEHDLWKLLWNVDTVKRTLAGCEALIMPLVFCARRFPVKGFSLSSSDWLYNTGSNHDTDLDFSALRNIEEQVATCFKKYHWNVDEASEVAASTMRTKGYVHADMKVEHVALMPQIDKSGIIVDLQPILIDLARVNCIFTNS
jgi:hypothetical protein